MREIVRIAAEILRKPSFSRVEDPTSGCFYANGFVFLRYISRLVNVYVFVEEP